VHAGALLLFGKIKMYGISPDTEWLAFSTNKGHWSLEAEESFSRKLKMLAQCVKQRAFNSYNFKSDVNLTQAQYRAVKNKILGVQKAKVKVIKFNGNVQ